ncbi:ATP-binding protein [Actinosynnema sp. CA-248983]
MSTKALRTSRGTNRQQVQVPAGITTVASQLRSTNLERDVLGELPPLYVGSRAQDTLGRINAALDDPGRTRAWSLTGPYGSGKSTLALLIDALVGTNVTRRQQALQLVAATNPELAERVDDSRARRAPDGFLGAITAARREPLVDTLSRALHNAIKRRWPSRRPKNVAEVLSALQATDAGSAQVLDAVEILCSVAPLLLVVDEFGKTLEHLATRSEFADGSDDLFLLQELAELGAGKTGLPLYVLTLQHLSFLDYASRSTTLQRREWAKIQGRFEDVTFTPDVGDAVQLIGRSLDQSSVSPAGLRLIKSQAEAASAAWSRRGLDGILPSDPQLFMALYPLHPLTAVAAPLLAAQVGQHDRSLTGFLASDEPHTVRRFLFTHEKSRATAATTVRLPQLYDYFLASGRTTVLASANASRWIEIDTRISEAHGLADEDIDVLKTVGLLNLVDSSGALRASEDTVLFALSDPLETVDDAKAREPLHDRLHDLVQRGFLVYREFSDEFRVWQGSDVDLRARIDEIRDRCDDHAVLGVLRRHLPVAVVAGRHSQRTGMLRHFVTAASERDSKRLDGPTVGDAADGLLLFHFGGETDVPQLDSVLPVAVGISDAAGDVLDAGRQVLALEELQQDATLDAVARREVGERLGQATAELAAVLAGAFSPTRPGTQWQLANGTRLAARSLAGVVSEACETAYSRTPEIRNEMLGRHQLTSQGAKARRELLTAMLTRPHDEFLGIEGFGPERAMYSGVLSYLKLRDIARDAHADEHGELVLFDYVAPGPADSLHPAWEAMTEALLGMSRQTPVRSVFELLMAPPFGVKAGVVPVIVLTALIIHRDEVALFEEGTYQPRLTPDLLERLVKTPDRFTIKSVGAAKGQRRLVMDKLAVALNVDTRAGRRGVNRNPAILGITQVLLDYIRTLSSYARRTKRMSEAAIAVRAELVSAREPDELIFAALASAVGCEPISVQARRDEAAADTYVSSLLAALEEVRTADTKLRDAAVQDIAQAFRLPNDLSTLRRDLAARARGFADVLLEPRIKGLVTLALNEQLADEDWLDPIVIRIAGTPLNDWDDATAQGFASRAQELARALDRVSHLYQVAQLNETAQPFEAQLVTLTGADGKEERTLVYMPQDAKRTADTVASSVLREAEKKLGPDGGRILLATLARRVLGSHESAGDGGDAATSPQKEAIS